MTDREEREQVLARLSNLLDVCPGQEIKLSFKDIMALEYAVNFFKKSLECRGEIRMTDRENYLKELQVMHDWMQAANFILSSPERIEALAYAISSIKTDLKYDLLYENEPIITLDELKDIRKEIARNTFFLSLSKERNAMGHVEWSDYLLRESDVLKILDKKISELEKTE